MTFSSAPTRVPLQDPPFRTDVRESTRPECEQENRAQKRTGVRAFKAPSEARRMVATAGTAASSRLDSWIHHPDEWVFYYLASKKDKGRHTIWSSLTSEAQETMLRRALGDADREGRLWTPLLDVLASEGVAMGLPNFSWGGVTYGASVEPVDARVDALGEWLAGENDWGRVEPLLRFDHKDVRQVLAERTPALEEGSLLALLNRDPDLARNVAQNPNLTADLARVLEAWAGRQICGAKWPVDENMGMPSVESGNAYVARDTLVGLQRRRLSLAKETLERLLETVTPWEPSADRYGGHKPPEEGRGLHPRSMAFQVLADDVTPLSTEDAYRLFERVRHQSSRVRMLLRKDGLPLEAKRQIAKESGAVAIREELARQPEARRDPEIRAELSRSTAVDVLGPLLEDATTGAEADALLAALFRSNELAALEAAIKRCGGRWDRLPERHWDLFMKASSPDVLSALARNAGSSRYRAIFRKLAKVSPKEAEAVYELCADRAPLLEEDDFWVVISKNEMLVRQHGVRMLFLWLMETGKERRAMDLLFSSYAVRGLMDLRTTDLGLVCRSHHPATCGTAFRRFFLRVLDRFGEVAACDILKQVPDEKLPSLSSADVVSLLESDSSALREAVIRVLRPGIGAPSAPPDMGERPFRRPEQSTALKR